MRWRCGEQNDFVLSVSSSGTNELQHKQPSRTETENDLSVSSSGTNELQPQAPRATGTPGCLFQFPLAERTSCNNVLRQGEKQVVNFQFPLAERTSCNCGLDLADTAGMAPFSFL